MGTFLMTTIAILIALSSFCTNAEPPLPCEQEKVEFLKDLTGIQRGAGEALKRLEGIQREAGEALKELAHTQRQKDEKMDQCQTLEESQSKLSLALAELDGRLDQGLNDLRLALNQKEERGRLDNLETKTEEKLQTITEALKSLTDRLDVIEAKEQLTGVEERRAFRPSCEPVGGDCVHVHYVGMTWAEARRYCQSLGGDLLVPSRKEGIQVISGYLSLSEAHPPLFDLLERKLNLTGEGDLFTVWLGGTADDGGRTARWTTGEQVDVQDHRAVTPGDCVAAAVDKGRDYFTGSHACNRSKYFPACH